MRLINCTIMIANVTDRKQKFGNRSRNRVNKLGSFEGGRSFSPIFKL